MAKLKELLSIGEAAILANTTAETLRHYDRIGIVKPYKIDKWTKYRYYTKNDIVKLNAVRALQQMDLSLKEIKEILEYDDLNEIIKFLEEAEALADQKINELEYGKKKIHAAKMQYISTLENQSSAGNSAVRDFPMRQILLSDQFNEASLDSLWNYQHRFYEMLSPELRDEFTFEDRAGIYTEGEQSRLFAVCINCVQVEGIKLLPKGRYLCADCDEENRAERKEKLIYEAKSRYDADINFIIEEIIVSGILQWKYQIQIYVDAQGEP